MKLSIDDLDAIQSLLRPIEERISGLESKVNERFDIVDQNFDALFKRDETNQQETLVTNEHISRLEKRITSLEDKGH